VLSMPRAVCTLSCVFMIALLYSALRSAGLLHSTAHGSQHHSFVWKSSHNCNRQPSMPQHTVYMFTEYAWAVPHLLRPWLRGALLVSEHALCKQHCGLPACTTLSISRSKAQGTVSARFTRATTVTCLQVKIDGGFEGRSLYGYSGYSGMYTSCSEYGSSFHSFEDRSKEPIRVDRVTYPRWVAPEVRQKSSHWVRPWVYFLFLWTPISGH
jgi:hypothetical protein